MRREYAYYAGSDPDYDLVPEIEKAINGQYGAIIAYARLAEAAPSEEEKKVILEIRGDEIRHYKVFSGIYYGLTKRRPAPQVTERFPLTYREGLEAAFKDEQETVDFYLDIADKARSPYIKQVFRRAAADEQNHAVWFLYFYTRPVDRC
ncbi:MAG: ferritin-like domain-containing protein [Syntrophomonadaceae bacterium]|nr:ferritin-like domain-containing protein [Syntrophomonadaceae bacterium]